MTDPTRVISEHLDGTLSDEGVALLNEWLAGDRDHAEMFVRYAVLHSRLRDSLEGERSLQAVLNDAADGSGIGEPNVLAHADAGASRHEAVILPIVANEEAASGVVGAVGEGSQPTWKNPRAVSASRRWMWRAGMAATVLLGAILTTSVQWSHRHNEIGRLKDVGLPNVVVQPIATLGAEAGAEWDAPYALLGPGQTLPTHPLFLKAGLAEVHCRNGVTMIVQGPARFQIQSTTVVDLGLGRLTATVPVGARGFTVNTQTAKVVDLGTEFGIEARVDESTRIEVFRGVVEAHALRASDPAGGSRRLTGNEAAEVATDAGAVRPVVALPDRFVRADELAARTKAEGSAYHRWLAYSYQLRRDPALVVYYMFDDATSKADRVHNHAATANGRWDAPLGASAPTWGRGRWSEKNALAFDAAKGQQLLLPDYPAAPDHRLTVAAWVFARPGFKGGAIAKNRGEKLFGQFAFGVWEFAGDLMVRVFEEDEGVAEVREGLGSPLPLGQWVHVAFVADGSTLRLYRDGREVANTPCTGPTSRPAIRSLAIGFRTDDDGQLRAAGHPLENWDGLFDELAIVHRALTADEIGQMYQAGRVDVVIQKN